MKTSYDLKLHRNVEKQLQRIPKKNRERLANTMRSLRENPRPSGCVKLDDFLYRIRQGQYRIIYGVFDDELVIVICKVARRSKDIYKNIQSLLDQAENLLGKE
jgi:mRNA interferase RelE/StbE